MYNKVVIKTTEEELTFNSEYNYYDGEREVCLEFEQEDEAFEWFNDAIDNKIVLKSIKMISEKKSKQVVVRLVKGAKSTSVYLIK